MIARVLIILALAVSAAAGEAPSQRPQDIGGCAEYAGMRMGTDTVFICSPDCLPASGGAGVDDCTATYATCLDDTCCWDSDDDTLYMCESDTWVPTGVGVGVGTAASFYAYLSTTDTLADSSWEKVLFDAEAWDVGADYDSATNYRYTPTEAGKYRYSCGIEISDDAITDMRIAIYKNGSQWCEGVGNTVGTNVAGAVPFHAEVTCLADMNGTTDYVECWGYVDSGDASETILGGTDGDAHFDGNIIAVGPAGPSGPEGATGAAGPEGATGVEGATGAIGPEGATGVGATGPEGATGTAGDTGPEGATGEEGATGSEGASGGGPSGPSGPSGPEGATGGAGPSGPEGVTGPSGPEGSTGANGPSGPEGATGAEGATGIEGATGADGPSAQIAWRMYLLSDQGSVAASTDTEVAYDRESMDDANICSTGTGRCTPDTAGWYEVDCTARAVSIANGKYWQTIVHVSGTRWCQGDRYVQGGTGAASSTAPCLVYADGNSDYIGCFVFHNDGTESVSGNADGSPTHFHGHYVRP